MRAFLLSSIGVLIFTSAHADCAAIPDKRIQTGIDKVSAPVYDARGREFKGCILHAKGKVLGYATEDSLCHGPLGGNRQLRLSYGCCDTGPDFGDAECIVRSKPLPSIGAAHGNGVTVHSAMAR